MAAAEGHIAHQRREGRGQEGHRRVFGKGLLLKLGIEPCPQDDGPDIENIFPEEGEAGHQPDLGDGEAVERVLCDVEEQYAGCRDQPGVDKGRAWPGDLHVVGDEHVLHGDDLPQPGQDIRRVVKDQRRRHQRRRIQEDQSVHRFVSDHLMPPYRSIKAQNISSSPPRFS